ncbi:hypothetical protein [Nocardia sp. NPDC049707]|uniref:hypothetical protein n=1 Tax=Nocardia sp. NPDC049707 TaxID=3154735 RepID=UPI0034170C2D
MATAWLDVPARLKPGARHPPIVPAARGSVEIAVQHADLGPSRPARQLAAHPGIRSPFSLTLRLFAPKLQVAQDDWKSYRWKSFG